jgi:MtN3 and saliva related transmembrane protein
MEINLKTIIGLIAAVCTTWAFLPQVIKIIKSRDTKSISLSMYIVFTTGVFLWFIYGIILNDIPIIVANFITLIFGLIVLVLKIKYG